MLMARLLERYFDDDRWPSSRFDTCGLVRIFNKRIDSSNEGTCSRRVPSSGSALRPESTTGVLTDHVSLA
jgi:hypothetical protein